MKLRPRERRRKRGGGAQALRLWAGGALAPAVGVALLGGAAFGSDDIFIRCAVERATALIACLEGPTSRYGHGALGESGEWDRLTFGDLSEALVAPAGPNAVFEDLHPRIADLDLDGVSEIVTVRSHETEGAAIVIYSASGDMLQQIAATPPIGTRHRWRAIAAIVDLDGEPGLEIAEVDRPHLAKVLRIWTFGPDGLREIASAPGFSNHRFGERSIRSAVRQCGAYAEVLLPDAGWTTTMAARVVDGEIRAKALGPWDGGAGMRRALACEDAR